MARVSLQYNNAATLGIGVECIRRPLQQKPFVDPAVYTNDRQFRMLLNYKLSNKTQTVLHLSASPTLQPFTRSCITSSGPNVGAT